jgi:hypothetical protein
MIVKHLDLRKQCLLPVHLDYECCLNCRFIYIACTHRDWDELVIDWCSAYERHSAPVMPLVGMDGAISNEILLKVSQ